MQESNSSGSGNATATAASSTPVTAAAPRSQCEIPQFCRSHFYTGKLLTEGDLNREQQYMMDKLRLHYVALHGWGVACGLMVRPHKQCPDRFVVTQGFAVDDCGREIRLVKDCVVHFPAPPAHVPEPCPPDPCDEGKPAPAHEPRRQTYYVCIRFNECQEDFMPVIFADCCGTSKRPNRVCECATIELLSEPPDCLRQREKRELERRPHDCHDLCHHIPEKCPPMGKVSCIPLAVIRDYVYWEPLKESMIDNSVRPVMPSVPRLEELVCCLIEHLPKPAPHLTHISRFHWEHDRVYSREEFLEKFVGTRAAPRGFEIEFDGRVHAKGLTNRSFQAMIVHEPLQGHEAHGVEIAPAHVVHSDNELRCILHIHPEYAHERLRERNFDVFLTLRCDKVIDEHGIPVDGNLLAGWGEGEEHEYVVHHHTGDGVPGGLFESWIRVRQER